jgi:hypothetical protein
MKQLCYALLIGCAVLFSLPGSATLIQFEYRNSNPSFLDTTLNAQPENRTLSWSFTLNTQQIAQSNLTLPLTPRPCPTPSLIGFSLSGGISNFRYSFGSGSTLDLGETQLSQSQLYGGNGM